MSTFTKQHMAGRALRKCFHLNSEFVQLELFLNCFAGLFLLYTSPFMEQISLEFETVTNPSLVMTGWEPSMCKTLNQTPSEIRSSGVHSGCLSLMGTKRPSQSCHTMQKETAARWRLRQALSHCHSWQSGVNLASRVAHVPLHACTFTESPTLRLSSLPLVTGNIMFLVIFNYHRSWLGVLFCRKGSFLFW